MSTTSDASGQPERTDRPRLIRSTVATLLIFGLCLLLPAGTRAWLRGWLFFAVTVAAGIVVSLTLNRVNPEVIAARVNRHTGTKGWDRWVVGLLIPTLVSILPVSALDARFHWSIVPGWVCGVGYVLYLTGLAGLTWAESVNKFFEPTVRIQTDRGHRVIDTGPYAIVRHPGYVSAVLLILGMPLALGSYWAMIPAVMAYAILVVRTVLEDRMLRDELPGYQDYARRVRYRLLPGIW